MKSFILLLLLFSATRNIQAQGQVASLPEGKYETKTQRAGVKWEPGDIVLLNDSKYRISANNEGGDYRFSVTAQRIFFTSGPLKGAYATTLMNNNQPVIVFPVSENYSLKLNSEIWALYKQ